MWQDHHRIKALPAGDDKRPTIARSAPLRIISVIVCALAIALPSPGRVRADEPTLDEPLKTPKELLDCVKSLLDDLHDLVGDQPGPLSGSDLIHATTLYADAMAYLDEFRDAVGSTALPPVMEPGVDRTLPENTLEACLIAGRLRDAYAGRSVVSAELRDTAVSSIDAIYHRTADATYSDGVKVQAGIP